MYINHNCQHYYGDLILTPYFYLFFTVFLFRLTKIIFLRLLIPLIFRVKSETTQEMNEPFVNTNHLEMITNPIHTPTPLPIDDKGKYRVIISNIEVNTMKDADHVIETYQLTMKYLNWFYILQSLYFVINVIYYFYSSEYERQWSSWTTYVNFYGYLTNGALSSIVLLFIDISFQRFNLEGGSKYAIEYKKTLVVGDLARIYLPNQLFPTSDNPRIRL